MRQYGMRVGMSMHEYGTGVYVCMKQCWCSCGYAMYEYGMSMCEYVRVWYEYV